MSLPGPAAFLPLALAVAARFDPLRADGPRGERAVAATAHLRDGTHRDVDAATWAPDSAREAGLVMLDVRAKGDAVADSLPRDRLEAELVDGERLIGDVRGGSGDRLQIRLGPAVTTTVEIDALANLRFVGRLAAGESALLEPAASGDRLYRSVGGRIERVDGTFLEFRDDGVGFESVLGQSTFAWADVVALFVAGAESGKSTPPSPAAVCLELADGARVFGDWIGSSASGLEFERAGARATIAWPWIDELSLRTADFTFLSELRRERTESPSPFGDDAGFTFTPRDDRAVDGSPLIAQGRTWRRGIGVHAPTRLVWRLDGSWSKLCGSAAIDDQVLRLPSRGSVRFRIHVDGEVAWESGVLRGGDAPVEWPPIVLAGAHELVLETDPTDDLHVADRADWLAPYLLR
jgi:hypothetical protein